MTADNFYRNIAISLGLHFFVVLLIFFRAVTMPSEPLELRNAIRVDVVGLPQKMQELPEPVTEKPAPVAPKTPDLPKKEEPTPVKPKAPEAPSPKAKAKPTH